MAYFFFLAYLMISVAYQSILSRKISFSEIFPTNEEEKEMVAKEINDWLSTVNEAGPNRIYLHLKNKTETHPSLIELRLRDIPLKNNEKASDVILSLDITNCISVDQIQSSDEWGKFYKLIKSEKDVLIVYLISQASHDSSYFFKFYPEKTLSPYGYKHEVLELLKVDDIYKNFIHDKFEHLKESYKDLRRLLFSFSKEFRSNFIGNFLFNDYLWANYIIETYGQLIDGKTYLLSGLDNIRVFGIVDDKSDERLSYTAKIVNHKIEIQIDKSQTEGDTNQGALQKSMNSEEYFASYGFLPETYLKDYIVANFTEIFAEEFSILNIDNPQDRIMYHQVKLYPSNENTVVFEFFDRINNKHESFKKLLNFFLEKVNKIHKSLVFTDYEEIEKIPKSEEQQEIIKQLKEFEEANVTEISSIKRYLKHKLWLIETIFHKLNEEFETKNVNESSQTGEEQDVEIEEENKKSEL